MGDTYARSQLHPVLPDHLCCRTIKTNPNAFAKRFGLTADELCEKLDGEVLTESGGYEQGALPDDIWHAFCELIDRANAAVRQR